jgi:ketosteroid isomerase-like protein
MQRVSFELNNEVSRMSEEDEVRTLIAKMSDLANQRDVDGLMNLYEAEAISFLFGGEPATLDKNRSYCVKGYTALRGKFSYEFVPFKVVASAEIAYVFGEERIMGSSDSGPFTSTINSTYCLKKLGGHWRITHQHLSMQNQEQTQ